MPPRHFLLHCLTHAAEFSGRSRRSGEFREFEEETSSRKLRNAAARCRPVRDFANHDEANACVSSQSKNALAGSECLMAGNEIFALQLGGQ